MKRLVEKGEKENGESENGGNIGEGRFLLGRDGIRPRVKVELVSLFEIKHLRERLFEHRMVYLQIMVLGCSRNTISIISQGKIKGHSFMNISSVFSFCIFSPQAHSS